MSAVHISIQIPECRAKFCTNPYVLCTCLNTSMSTMQSSIQIHEYKITSVLNRSIQIHVYRKAFHRSIQIHVYRKALHRSIQIHVYRKALHRSIQIHVYRKALHRSIQIHVYRKALHRSIQIHVYRKALHRSIQIHDCRALLGLYTLLVLEDEVNIKILYTPCVFYKTIKLVQSLGSKLETAMRIPPFSKNKGLHFAVFHRQWYQCCLHRTGTVNNRRYKHRINRPVVICTK